MVEEWKRLLSECITHPKQLLSRFKIDIEPLEAVVAKYPMKISKHYFNLIEEVDDPIWKQCVPSPLELQDEYGVEDPLNEEVDSPIPGLVH
ncbi:MAG: lysine 2,3-aminomutase, partial [Candidatus Bathyarchaeia archaeon]